MTATVLTHLNFAGNAREALAFYQSVFGGVVNLRTYAESGVPHDSTTGDLATFDPVPADSPDADRVSFGLLVSPTGLRLAAYDVFGADPDAGPAVAGSALPGGARRADGLTHTEPFFVMLTCETREEVEPLWHGLADGGTVVQTLAPTAWSPAYGMLTDRHGVTWVLGAMA